MRPATILCFLVTAVAANAGDWASWRGPTSNGVATDTNLPEKFKVAEAGKDGLLWKAPHGCRSCPIVVGDRVYFNTHAGVDKVEEGEAVVCLDAKTGKQLWEHKFNVFFTDIVSSRVGWTNLVADPASGNIYCHGTSGLLICFDKDGTVKWQHSLAEEFGRVSGYGGRLTSPIVDGDLLIIGMNCAAWGEYGRGGCRFIAFDKKDGSLVWWGSTRMRVLDSFQSSPTVATIGGQRLLLSGGGDGGLHAFKVGTGEKVWSIQFCKGAVNVTPVVDGNLVYCAHGDINPDNAGQQGRIICVDGSQVEKGAPKVVWKIDGVKIKFASPIFDKGRLILNDEDGRLHCLNAKDGTTIWESKVGGGGNVRCSPVLADGKFYVGDSRGFMYVLKDNGDKKPKETLALRLQSKDPKTGNPVKAELDGSVSIANGHIFFGSGTETYCVGTGGPQAGAGAAAPAKPQAARAAASPGKPAHLQVVPAEVTLSPGGNATFKAKLFDENGVFLREVKPEWSLGPILTVEEVPGLPPPPKISPPALKGELTQDGKLTVPSDLQGQWGNVVAKVEGIEGHARVRQLPKLPYKQDFEKVPPGGVPAGWINSQIKFQVREVDGGKVLVKTATNKSALVAIANAFFGGVDWTDYTIEADVLGKQVGGVLPNMGVIANRYTFFLFGEGQQLRLISWEGLLRIDQSIAFTWKADTWYRLKLSVSQNGDKTLVRGKIWERSKQEPEKWTVEVEDPLGNKSGSAGLHAEVPPETIQADKPGAEVFFDNISVTPNKAAKEGGKAVPPKKEGAGAKAAAVETVPTSVSESCSERPRFRLFRR